MYVKKSVMLLAVYLLASCQGSSPTGSLESYSSDAKPIDVSMSLGAYGTLQVSSAGLIAGEEGHLAVTFTADQELRSYEQVYDNQGSGGNGVQKSTIYPTIRFSFNEAETECNDGCKMYAEGYLQYISKSGTYIQTKDLNSGNSFTLYFKVRAYDSFTLKASLTGDGIDETSEQNIQVSTSSKSPVARGPIARARKRALQAAGRSYSTTNYISIDVEPLPGYDKASWGSLNLITGHKANGHAEKTHLGIAIIDYKEALTVGQSAKLKITLVSSGYENGHNIGGLVKQITSTSSTSCQNERSCGRKHTTASEYHTEFIITLPPDKHSYVLRQGGIKQSTRELSFRIPVMQLDEVKSYEFSVEPLTRYFTEQGKFPIVANIFRGRVKNTVINQKLDINLPDGLKEYKLGDHFRLKTQELDTGGFKVSFTALQDVQDPVGSDTKVRLFCGAKCEHTSTNNEQHISVLRLEYNVIERGGYVYSFKVKESMKKGNSFALFFGKVWGDVGPYQSGYKPSVQYWPRDNMSTSFNAYLDLFKYQ